RSARPEEGGALRPVEHAEPEDVLVEGDRAVEVGDLEADAAEARRGRQPVARRREADVGAGVHGHGGSNGEGGRTQSTEIAEGASDSTASVMASASAYPTATAVRWSP